MSNQTISVFSFTSHAQKQALQAVIDAPDAIRQDQLLSAFLQNEGLLSVADENFAATEKVLCQHLCVSQYSESGLNLAYDHAGLTPEEAQILGQFALRASAYHHLDMGYFTEQQLQQYSFITNSIYAEKSSGYRKYPRFMQLRA